MLVVHSNTVLLCTGCLSHLCPSIADVVHVGNIRIGLESCTSGKGDTLFNNTL